MCVCACACACVCKQKHVKRSYPVIHSLSPTQECLDVVCADGMLPELISEATAVINELLVEYVERSKVRTEKRNTDEDYDQYEEMNIRQEEEVEGDVVEEVGFF